MSLVAASCEVTSVCRFRRISICCEKKGCERIWILVLVSVTVTVEE